MKQNFKAELLDSYHIQYIEALFLADLPRHITPQLLAHAILEGCFQPQFPLNIWVGVVELPDKLACIPNGKTYRWSFSRITN